MADYTESSPAVHYALAVDAEPLSVQEALSGPDAPAWEAAMEEEMRSLKQNGTWDLESIPDQRPIPSKWVFALKRDENGRVTRYKARLVARGDRQRAGIDYEYTRVQLKTWMLCRS